MESKTENKMTPESWSFQKSSCKWYAINANQEEYKWVASTNGLYEPSEELRLAKLIAAAPELLKSLIKCLEGVEELNGEYQDGWDKVIAEAKEAINKATL